MKSLNAVTVSAEAIRKGAITGLARLLPLALLSGLLAACGAISTAPPPVETFYRLPAPQQVATIARSQLKGGLLIASLSADPLHQDRAMIFATDAQGLRLQAYNYHQWVDTLPQLVREYMVAYLQQSGLADWVSGSERTANGAYEIHGRLQRFERLGSDAEPRLVVALRLWLRHGDAAQPMLRKSYQAEVAMQGGEPGDMARAGQLALARILKDFVADVRNR